MLWSPSHAVFLFKRMGLAMTTTTNRNKDCTHQNCHRQNYYAHGDCWPSIGVLGCVFAPDALSFALGGQEWWDRVYALHPSQRTLESSTSLVFALFAVEASMISHRVGKTGASCYRDIVPAFVVVCSVLAILPCVFALHWLGDDVSYFSSYRE